MRGCVPRKWLINILTLERVYEAKSKAFFCRNCKQKTGATAKKMLESSYYCL
jgi:hypothetical protein